MTGERVLGRVERVHQDGKYGFISRADGKGRVFVSASDVSGSGLGDLKVGLCLSFEVEDAPRGPRAASLETGWPKGYLEGGYFETVGGEKQVKPAVVDEWADAVAQILESGKMKAHQLRRFFNKARAIERKLDREASFARVVTDIHTFKRDAAYAVSRQVAPTEFKECIDRNVGFAVQDEDSFRRGFLEHFQSIVAYFTYYSWKREQFRKKEARS